MGILPEEHHSQLAPLETWYPVTASHTQKRLKLNSALKLQNLTTSWWFQPL
jgi:hypothetical protein